MIFRDRRESGAEGDPERDPAPAGGGSEVESILSERVERILEAAEEAAAGIREEAEREAGRYLNESRQRADALAAERIREISQLTDWMIAALDDAGRRVADQTGWIYAPPPRYPPPAYRQPPVPPQPPYQTPPAAPPPPASPRQLPSAQPPYQPPPPAPAPPIPERARLLATQMAAAGSSREEIARRLNEEFAIEDSRAILNELGI